MSAAGEGGGDLDAALAAIAAGRIVVLAGDRLRGGDNPACSPRYVNATFDGLHEIATPRSRGARAGRCFLTDRAGQDSATCRFMW